MLNRRPFMRKGFFIDTGTYQPMYLRTYQTNYNQGLVDQFMQGTDNGQMLSNSAMAKVLSGMITPSANISGNIQMENGWNEKRYSFMLEFDVPDPFNGEGDSIVLTGYTSYADASLSGHFDPRMKLYINACNTVGKIANTLPNGSVSIRKILKGSQHVLTGSLSNIVTSNTPVTNPYSQNTLVVATPKNIVNAMISHNQGYYGSDQHPVFDTRAYVSGMSMQLSSRENAIASSYTSRIIDTTSSNIASVDAGIGVDENKALINASASVAESSMVSNHVLSEIVAKTNFNNDGYITWGDLNRLFPETNDNSIATTRASNPYRQQNQLEAEAGNFDGWNSVNYETIIATTISQSIPALMVSSLLGEVQFTLQSDDGFIMQPLINVISAMSIVDGIEVAPLVNKLISRIQTEIVPVITNQFQSSVSVFVSANLFTDTVLQVSYNDGVPIPFCAPTFCDSLYSPVLSTNVQTIQDISHDLYSYVNAISSNQYLPNAGSLTNY